MWVRNLGGPFPKKFGGSKTSKFRILRFDREYLPTGTRYRWSENGVENCNHFPTCVPNLVNFGPQTAKNRTFISTHSVDFFGGSYLRGWEAPVRRFAIKSQNGIVGNYVFGPKILGEKDPQKAKIICGHFMPLWGHIDLKFGAIPPYRSRQ